MAITNAQQFKQLVNPPMDGKRPGYRGDAAYGDRSDKDAIGDGPARSGPTNNQVDTGDLGSEAANVRANIAASLGGSGTSDPQESVRTLQRFLNRRKDVNVPGLFGRFFKKPIQKFADFSAAKNRDFFQKVIGAGKLKLGDKTIDLEAIGQMTDQELEDTYKDYMSERLAGRIDAFGNLLIQGDDSSPLLRTGIMAQAPKEDEEEDPFFPNFRLMAEGGRADLQDGGLADIARQELFLGGVADTIGKGLKKATRAIKKIAKSPIGKAALLYAGGSFLSGKGIFGSLQPSFLKNMSVNKALMQAGSSDYQGGATSIFDLIPGGKTGAAILGTSIAAGLTTPKEDKTKTTDLGPDIDDPELIMRYPELYRNFRQFAEGGSTDKEPVAKKTMPLLDMGGKEMDLREEGGFVPIGRMEKADDVPARLSKNEFVFTADAVRNAGDGDVDKGAEVMYNMMKNLEAGGEVSEESQGMDGARKMFQTSQRLGEVL